MSQPSTPALPACPPALIAPLRPVLRGIPGRVAVAASGGADSAMLALAAAHALRERAGELLLFHVHHGLQAMADHWAAQVVVLGGQLGAAVHVARVDVPAGTGKGIEAAARDARYHALGALAARHGAAHVLLAHHRDDQAETVLLRLLRGSGPHGMAAMAPVMARGGVQYLRPWLDLPRQAIRQAARAHAESTGWQAADDPTNADPRYTRAAVRTQLAPVLDARWPGWQAIVARHARQMAEAAQILDEVAAADLQGLDPDETGRSLSLAAWRQLSPPRQAQVLRHWLAVQGVPMPTEARLGELLRQLRQVHQLGHDRALCLRHAGHLVRCVRGRICLEEAGQGG